MSDTPEEQSAADLRACNGWQDGEGAEVVTVEGIWFAALFYERARLEVIRQNEARQMKLGLEGEQ